MTNVLQIIKTSLILILLYLLYGCYSAQSSADQVSEEKKIATAKINIQLGMAYLDKQYIQRAKKKLLSAIEQAPDLPEAWYAMAYFQEATGNYALAEKQYLHAINLSPKQGAAHNNYGTYLCRTGKYKKSVQQFLSAIEDQNYLSSAAAYENAGLCSMKIPDRRLAMYYFKRALMEDPSRTVASAELSKDAKMIA